MKPPSNTTVTALVAFVLAASLAFLFWTTRAPDSDGFECRSGSTDCHFGGEP